MLAVWFGLSAEQRLTGKGETLRPYKCLSSEGGFLPRLT